MSVRASASRRDPACAVRARCGDRRRGGFGQTLERAYAPDKTTGAFLFWGYTGVGKIELAKALADCE